LKSFSLIDYFFFFFLSEMCFKDPLIIVINMGVFLSLFNMELISSFFPAKALEKGISEETIGVIFSFHPVGWFLVSLFSGKFLIRPGMRKYLINSSFIFSILGLVILLGINWI
jgi:MFS family permease